MLAIMCNELQKEHENTSIASEILFNLQRLHGRQNKTIGHKMSKQLFMLKMLKGLNVENNLHNLIKSRFTKGFHPTIGFDPTIPS